MEELSEPEEEDLSSFSGFSFANLPNICTIIPTKHRPLERVIYKPQNMAETKEKKTPTKKETASKKSDVFAVIATGGKQYKVSEGDIITIEKLANTKEGDKVTFENVLLTDDGSKTDIGAPYIKGKKVTGTVEKEGRGKKIEVIRFRAKSRYFKNKGHRQPFMNVLIEKIS